LLPTGSLFDLMDLDRIEVNIARDDSRDHAEVRKGICVTSNSNSKVEQMLRP